MQGGDGLGLQGVFVYGHELFDHREDEGGREGGPLAAASDDGHRGCACGGREGVGVGG